VSAHFASVGREFWRQLHAEVAAGVGEADIFHHAADEPHIIRDLPARDVSAEKIAQRAAEILVARVAEEAARIRDELGKIGEEG
jgi:hypothetical protein